MTAAEPVLRRGADRHVVVVEREFPHHHDQVWHAVTTAASLAQWFPGAPEFALHVGAAMRFPDFAGSPAEFGEVLECEPAERLRFRWDTDEMALDLHEETDGTRLVLIHEIDDLPGAASIATGWEACLELLDAVLEQRPVPDPGPRAARHEELAREFRLDEAVLDRTVGGWSLRFARQLVCPIETAWELLVGSRDVLPEESRAAVAGEALHALRPDEEVLGFLTDVTPPTQLSADIAAEEPGDHLHLELGPGTGHGARLTLSVHGRDPQQTDPAAARWRDGLVRPLARSALEAQLESIDRSPADG